LPDKEETLQQICFYLLLSTISSLAKGISEILALIAVKNVAMRERK